MPPVASSSTSRALFVFLCPARRRQLSFFLDPLRSCRPNKPSCPTQSRAVSTASPQRSEMEVSPEDSQTPPRWSQTPPAMRSPVPIPSKPNAKPWIVNSDPQKLDQMYQKFLGKGGEKLLGEETRWLAITHKSFDHGRRGFNDRLSFLGMRILELQTSLALLTVSDSSRYLKEKDQDELKREAFRHPAINSVECLLGGARTHFTSHKQLSELGTGYGLPEVVRWKPKNPDRLAASGCDMVYAQAMLAIVGALALEQGLAVANKVAKERILRPLGLYKAAQDGGDMVEPRVG